MLSVRSVGSFIIKLWFPIVDGVFGVKKEVSEVAEVEVEQEIPGPIEFGGIEKPNDI